MDQMAENTPEVEIETDASEQIPDDVELAEEVETEDGSESSGNDAEEATETDDDESEQEFYFGDEKLDSPTSEDSAEHGLVKHLRKTIKEKDRELKELMRQSQKPVEQQPVITQPLQLQRPCWRAWSPCLCSGCNPDSIRKSADPSGCVLR